MLDDDLVLDLHCQSPALTLAEAFLCEVGAADEAEEERTREVILVAGEHLAETAGPGRWELFDAESFFAKISFESGRDRIGAGLILVGFFGWLFLRGLIPAARCLEIVGSVREHAPESEILVGLHRKTMEMVEWARTELC